MPNLKNSFHYRFDIVIFNYNHLHCFFNNFWRIKNFNPNRDLITCLSASSSHKERKFFEDSCISIGIKSYRYLPRKNFGMAEKARIEYFSGKFQIDSLFIFQMQDHYLDLQDSCSIWDEKHGGGIKGDVSPDISFDLDEIERLFMAHNISTIFADRGKALKFSIGNRNFIAPNGGNFIIKSSELSSIKKHLNKIGKTCNDTYSWAIFMEHYWGELFFEEKKGTFDYYNKVLLLDYSENEMLFKESGDDYYTLRNTFLSPTFFPSKLNSTLYKTFNKLLSIEKRKKIRKIFKFS